MGKSSGRELIVQPDIPTKPLVDYLSSEASKFAIVYTQAGFDNTSYSPSIALYGNNYSSHDN